MKKGIVLLGLQVLIATAVTAQIKMSKAAQDRLPDPCRLLHSGTHYSADCNNALPADNINDSVFPGSKFLLRYDSLTSYTWVKMKSGDSLLVIECGCSYITTTLFFTTKHYSADTNNVKYWYKAAAELIVEAQPGLISGPFDYKKSADTLKQFIKKYPDSLQYHRAILFFKIPAGDSESDDETMAEMTPSFTIDGVRKLSNGDYVVIVEYNISLD